MSEANQFQRETISCPYCGVHSSSPWSTELGFQAVRCNGCALIYVNPRPRLSAIDAAVRTGVHSAEAQQLNVMSRRSSRKVARYRRTLGRLFADYWHNDRKISWLDIGAGYGEVVEAIVSLAPTGSVVEGIEPMKPKAQQARTRGLTITEDYLRPTHAKVDVISAIDVFSHIPDFRAFLDDVKSVLNPRGEVFIETGNLADLECREEFPGELGLPDHLVFAGEKHLRGYLLRAGFEVVCMESQRVDGPVSFIKNLAKRIVGRPVTLAIPFSSPYRQLLVRARLST